MHARKQERRVRALVLVRNRIELWTKYGKEGLTKYQGKTVDPNAKLNMAIQEEADLAKLGVK